MGERSVGVRLTFHPRSIGIVYILSYYYRYRKFHQATRSPSRFPIDGTLFGLPAIPSPDTGTDGVESEVTGSITGKLNWRRIRCYCLPGAIDPGHPAGICSRYIAAVWEVYRKGGGGVDGGAFERRCDGILSAGDKPTESPKPYTRLRNVLRAGAHTISGGPGQGDTLAVSRDPGFGDTILSGR